MQIVFKKCRVQSKTCIESTIEKDIKEPEPRKACKYLGIEDNLDIEH